ncbi:MAG: glycosyl transferase group 1 [Bacteroidetes bacterium]|jgi:glycosyltransferase involved in cell wall biosynthesis|nr:glycosyl transferase group 1 [Bacteroidota bacterium]
MSAKLLFYYPSNKRTIAFNSELNELKKRGYELCLLTTCEEGVFHEDCGKLGIQVFSHPVNSSSSVLYYFKQIRFLIRFCRKNRIDTVLSNLQHTNFISVLARFFMRAKVVTYRHHFNYTNLIDTEQAKNRNEMRFDRIINRFAKKIVVPSLSVKEGMVKFEGADPAKIFLMQYLYDFDMYDKPDPAKVAALKEKHKSGLILLMCARLIKLKGHATVFGVIKKLVEEKKADLQLLVLDEGPEKETLQKFISDNQLQDHIHLIGFCKDIQNYMACADLMVHPSLTEASNSAVKEMALQGKTSIVCAGVGDFSEYFNDGNGFLIDPNRMEEEIHRIISGIRENKSILAGKGDELRKAVMQRFGVTKENVDKFIDSFEN